jgi:pyrimidine operon attenuation protein/uracil phosphoribosyltransferase
MVDKNYILNKETAQLKLERLALEIAEELNGDTTPLVLIGITNSGMVIAQKMNDLLKKYINDPIQLISATLNKATPSDVQLSEQVDFNQKNIIVCDDVANSGKTLLYVLKPLLAFHPKRIQILVLVERMHKLFPIKPDYVGLSIATTLQDNIVVEIDNNEILGAYIQ